MGAQWEAGTSHQIWQLLAHGHAFLVFLFFALSGLASGKVRSHPQTALTSSINAELGGGVPKITLRSDNARSCEL